MERLADRWRRVRLRFGIGGGVGGTLWGIYQIIDFFWDLPGRIGVVRDLLPSGPDLILLVAIFGPPIVGIPLLILSIKRLQRRVPKTSSELPELQFRMIKYAGDNSSGAAQYQDILESLGIDLHDGKAHTERRKLERIGLITYLDGWISLTETGYRIYETVENDIIVTCDELTSLVSQGNTLLGILPPDHERLYRGWINNAREVFDERLPESYWQRFDSAQPKDTGYHDELNTDVHKAIRGRLDELKSILEEMRSQRNLL